MFCKHCFFSNSKDSSGNFDAYGLNAHFKFLSFITKPIKMKKYSLGYSFMFSAIFSVLFFSCSKQTPTANNTNTGGTGTGTGVTVPGTVASYETIPIPGVNIAGKIGALPTQFYCTNIGPYVNVFNGNSRSNVIYKYRGGTGSDDPGNSARRSGCSSCRAAPSPAHSCRAWSARRRGDP